MSVPRVLLTASALLLAAGVSLLLAAVFCERRMHRHRQPGVSYADATFRRDGGWRRADLFTAEGLRWQRRASALGLAGALCWVLALGSWALSRVTA